MGEVCVDFLDTYRTFFERFTSSVDLSDQLPVKVAGYNLVECEIPGAIADWTLQYLEQRKCPPFLIAHLIRKVVEEVRLLSKTDPVSCGFRSEVGDYLSLKLMQVCITKLVDVCSRYRDNAELSSLPPPHPLPPVTSCAIKNSRRSMEDRHVVIHDFHALFNIKGWGPASYYGIMDGHNGIDAAIYSVSHLHQYLAESPHYPANPVRALHDACCKTDDLFTIKAQRENLHGGTTAVVALLRPKEQKLYVAWLGDSQAMLVRQGRPMQIVRPHKPDRPDERDRIEGMGGTVLYWGAWRVNGQLAVSRAIGDAEYKPYVTAKPDIEEITLDGTEDFLVLACDGLWDFVSEQQATNAIYKQLRENPEDLEAVSHRLVALSKEQSSQDNISVVVVFLTDPAELAKRPPMETPIPNPFNGAEVFNGQHHRGDFDDEDFGPETDVDMVDDALLSPTPAVAAKALVHTDDDFERQRQQMKEFDDPVDLDASRDTPTPPLDLHAAHQVARDVSGDNLAESGGEDSEEEWNYIPGNDPQSLASIQPDTKQDEEDMNSQLNPNAAEFVPVSPKNLVIDDTIIASSPTRGFEKPLDNIRLPSEVEFSEEISKRPGDLEYSNGLKPGDDYLNNFSTLHHNTNEINPTSAHSELASESPVNFDNNTQGNIPFDKLAALQNMEEKVTSAVLEKANIFGMNNDFSNNAFEATNIFGKSDPMTASFMGNDLPGSPEPEDNIIPGTPRSTTVEAPTSPTAEDIAHAVHQTELDSPVDDFAAETQKSPDLISPGDGPQDGILSVQERTSSSGFESESGADEVEPNVESIPEHRSSPMDLCFKPVQSFNDTNPFSASEVVSSTSPMDQFDTLMGTQKISPIQTPTKNVEADRHEDHIDFTQNVLPSFVSPRFKAETVPFDHLESPKDIPVFLNRPSSDISDLATELSKSPENLDEFENVSPVQSETCNYKTNVNDITQELFSDDTNPEVEETSFTTTEPKVNVESHVDLDSTEGFLVTESKIMQDGFGDQIPKLDELSGTEALIPSPVSPKAVDQVLAAFDDIKLDEQGSEIAQEVNKESDNDVETKEMKLEFESHISDSQPIHQQLNNLDEGFEVIHKEELNTQDIVMSEDLKKESEQVLNFASAIKETNPFMMDDVNSPTNPADSQNTFNSDFLNAVDQFSTAVNEEAILSENITQLSSSQPDFEPEVTRLVSYQTHTPANEPQLTKSETYLTEQKAETESSILNEMVSEVKPADIVVLKEEKVLVAEKEEIPASVDVPIVVETDQKGEPAHSTTVTETLITALEETSDVPSAGMVENSSSTGTPPPTPATGLDDSKELQDTHKPEVLVAAVAAAGAVVAGSAILSEKETKKTKESVPKKPAVGAKKPTDVSAKSTAKPSAPKAPASKLATTKTTTTTKADSAAGKPSTASTKPATARPASATTATKKTTTAAPSKPAPPKPAPSAAPKSAPASTKPVPNRLPLNKTSTQPKSLSKPSTPTSKPTTPTALKSPLVKPEVAKSPARPGLTSPLVTKTLGSKPASGKTAEKKPLTNGDIKPIPKKTEVPKKTTTTTTKPPANRPITSTVNKTAPKLPGAVNALKPKSTLASTTRPTATAANRPNTAPAKMAIGKETNNKLASKTKPALNGKSAPAKTAGGMKKTDPKQNTAKPETKPPPIKKPEDFKKEEEKPNQIQEAAVTTTSNGFADHHEDHESLKIEDSAPATVETVN